MLAIDGAAVALKDVGEALRSDAPPRVLHLDDDSIAGLEHAHLDPSALRGELDGVPQQIAQGELEAPWIAPDVALARLLLSEAEAELARVLEKLGNERFVSRAPENVVQAEREKEIKLRALIEKLKA